MGFWNSRIVSRDRLLVYTCWRSWQCAEWGWKSWTFLTVILKNKKCWQLLGPICIQKGLWIVHFLGNRYFCLVLFRCVLLLHHKSGDHVWFLHIQIQKTTANVNCHVRRLLTPDSFLAADHEIWAFSSKVTRFIGCCDFRTTVLRP